MFLLPKIKVYSASVDIDIPFCFGSPLRGPKKPIESHSTIPLPDSKDQDVLDVFTTETEEAIPIWVVTSENFQTGQKSLSDRVQSWVLANRFKALDHQILMIPNNEGEIEGVIYGLPANADHIPFPFASLSSQLPSGTYQLTTDGHQIDSKKAALDWAMGRYQYAMYKTSAGDSTQPKLVIPKDIAENASRIADAVYLTRDLVNAPGNHMGPDELEEAVHTLARRFDADINVTTGAALIADNFPLIHAVGRASTREPRLLDLTWGPEDAPKVTLVGKGVCFDSGGLNLKPGDSMTLMKKDMGGAANVIGLGHMIMSSRLPVRLRILIPAVENSISGNAFRPGDVIPSRSGKTVEIGNTDAEGRLVLADALTLADDDEPDLLIDMATLTGAARVALGPDFAPFYTHDDALALDLAEHAKKVTDPLWRMPLWSGYDASLKGKVGDINHISDMSMAGSITAALFLSRFVSKAKSWVHFDIFAWTPKPKPGQPVGGEAQGIRALHDLIQSRYPQHSSSE